MDNLIDKTKEPFLFVGILLISVGATELVGKEWITAGILLLAGLVVIIIRGLLEKKGIEIEREKITTLK